LSPGLKIVCPAFPDDAKGLLTQSIRDPDPVLFLEPQRLYRRVRGPVPAGEHLISLGESRLVREGSDLLFVAWSAAVHMCLEAASQLANDGVSAAVLDLRTLNPLDVAGLVKAFSPIGRAVIVHEAVLTSGFGAEIAATLQHEAFSAMDAPIERVAAWDAPYPPGALEDWFVPSLQRILHTARRTLEY
jgi:pyruvate/2-oxoglutarate/acetoin dehydrogenase E1 component